MSDTTQTKVSTGNVFSFSNGALSSVAGPCTLQTNLSIATDAAARARIGTNEILSDGPSAVVAGVEAGAASATTHFPNLPGAAGRIAPGAALIGGFNDIHNVVQHAGQGNGAETVTEIFGVGGQAGGAWIGAELGGTVGSIFPGPGTVIGTGLGAGLGAFGGAKYAKDLGSIFVARAMDELRSDFKAADYSNDKRVTTFDVYGNHCGSGGGADKGGTAAAVLEGITTYLGNEGVKVADVLPENRFNPSEPIAIRTEAYQTARNGDVLTYEDGSPKLTWGVEGERGTRATTRVDAPIDEFNIKDVDDGVSDFEDALLSAFDKPVVYSKENDTQLADAGSDTVSDAGPGSPVSPETANGSASNKPAAPVEPAQPAPETIALATPVTPNPGNPQHLLAFMNGAGQRHFLNKSANSPEWGICA